MPSHTTLEIAAEVAQTSAVPLDRLPYSPELERLAKVLSARTGREYSPADAWQLFIDVRKRGLLGKRFRGTPRSAA